MSACPVCGGPVYGPRSICRTAGTRHTPLRPLRPRTSDDPEVAAFRRGQV